MDPGIARAPNQNSISVNMRLAGLPADRKVRLHPWYLGKARRRSQFLLVGNQFPFTCHR